MKDIRERTYEILGLPLGSLSNEGGRDWNEAKKEASRELNVYSTQETRVINESDIERIVYSDEYSDYNDKIKILNMFKLKKELIIKLIDSNDKDIILAALRTQELDDEIIRKASSNGTYLVTQMIKKLDQKSYAKNMFVEFKETE